ncbi:tRNA (adenosine(37)-N6)-threonylcarbamoyltransferase complex ATPase subunit type 1 TsaE [Cognatazoarcus halotolerans]|uniref:tRNA (adenosine(37)-N6)-threonylcarbamoyltransferase complex ATPase subunit type 1 TsaE n=1 Tax=Cognatazoarcus halotolerans TaxID=2686016 RepID=UPI001359D302|nr:tRNA (adenosine(37)-N6)-threonylcarbamoyltransferase complex ATPase subunit type 1 TsaE [Cognatazoarcus halotolerans]MBX3678715.1 tRNA (adenosine(37)-N6)-threonylcarbamoyltransferase complex ATPase subunit type 1 TsaE [Rhodocyclaceae bacterium]MCB1899466.1 tRNA (adenosine(37)-N6)-threonylcarbamoyltransferase complex ATPase subunit type 1 TsaE [Rhodocyclaceae bacterium]MCP5309404.1 tRNA (adenosine(37)-N6)-threonylcarbamoyltransferase complex ATPase subunit type 1 TsaE [Zoogloeaceae bacterium]
MHLLFHALDDSGNTAEIALQNEEDTMALGAAMAPALAPGLIIYLSGDLGAGKTTLTRGVVRALGFRGNVKSPTYTLVEPYVDSRIHLYHFDFYRFTHPDEYLEAGLDEYFAGQGVCLVEWPRHAAPHIPAPDLEIELEMVAQGRHARLHALTEAGRKCIQRMSSPER